MCDILDERSDREILKDQGYRELPWALDYMINRDGDLINLRYNMRHIKPRDRYHTGKDRTVRMSIDHIQVEENLDQIIKEVFDDQS